LQLSISLNFARVLGKIEDYDEKNVSAKQKTPEKRNRFPQTDENEKRKEDPESPPQSRTL
jgi:hypothetical protein